MNLFAALLLGLILLLLAFALQYVGKRYRRRPHRRPHRRAGRGLSSDPAALPPISYPQPTHYKAGYESMAHVSTPPPDDPISPLSVFHSKPPLTEREAQCYWSLAKHLNGHYLVLPQVAFSAFLRVEGGDGKSNYRRFATMRQKVADFLIVRPDFSIVALIELDDRTHANKKEADQQRDAAIKQAGIRVFRIPKVPHGDQVQRLCDVLLKLDQLRQA